MTEKSIQTSDSHGPSVKPLEWYSDPMAFPAPTWGAQSSFGRFIIEEVSASDTPAYEVRYTPHHLISITDSLDDAKSAAQADYKKRILSALDPSATAHTCEDCMGDALALVAQIEAQERLIETLTAALELYGNPEVYRPHPHGLAFDNRDLSFAARTALAQARKEQP